MVPSAQDRLVDYLTRAMPPEATGLLREWVNQAASKTTGSLLSFSLLGSLWEASSGIAALYFAPNARQHWRWITPGAIFAVAAMVIASFLFSIYLRYAPSYSVTYSSLGAVIVLMLWLYILGLTIFLGGEFDSEVEKAAGRPAR